MLQNQGKCTRASKDHMRTDPALMRAICDPANHEAWCTFESRYAPIIRSFCISRGMGPHDAADVAQEVFLRISKYGFADRYDPSLGTFRSYLFRVSRSVVSEIGLRKMSQMALHEFVAESEDAWDQVWRVQAIRLAVDRVSAVVSPQAKQVLSLTMRGLKPAEIAESTGLSKHMVYKSRQRLRAKIEMACKEFSLNPSEI